MNSRGCRRSSKENGRGSHRRKRESGIELNDTLSTETRVSEVPDRRRNSNSAQANGSRGSATNHQADYVMIDVDEMEDDCVVSSPRRFNEARNRSKRKERVPIMVDDEPIANHSGPSIDEMGRNVAFSTRSIKRRKNNPAGVRIITCDPDDGCGNGDPTVKESKQATAEVTPKEKFCCPICINTISEETTTVCGHIFCMGCIKTAIKAQGKCPTCRRKLTARSIHRIFLSSIKC
ncbi:E3 ubiquitin-protein ligase RNF4 [Amborella trichopoda]|uniref:RING-type domain-containing protein n=1 Tax=Amborella trichopoda TaxID=13333 RepID=W1NR13_AMBTC|nr:E3 ubiquitin-protein ligase RNF4 [Amborella trichopoda]XP_011620344.1 E3 ubiquitin-protein ligase RNF4 [Amborella trichopoda]ERM97948.1 hypothetical protein AMTR_s00117p00068520 [Amborella trichopoda]|eukprot:XP_006830532.1 E3 ubiquitin-protein ligase RNF4 [Amborella trichopoda]